MNETLYALATAPGRAALAVVRLSGPDSRRVLETLTCRPAPKVRQMQVRQIHGPDGGRVDECLVVWFKGPGSFTGEDVVELHLHGGAASCAKLLYAM